MTMPWDDSRENPTEICFRSIVWMLSPANYNFPVPSLLHPFEFVLGQSPLVRAGTIDTGIVSRSCDFLRKSIFGFELLEFVL